MNEIQAGSSTAESVLDKLMHAGQTIEQHIEAALQPHGLSIAKIGALRVLVTAARPLPLGVLSQRLGCVRSNITQLVDRLEADKLVRRVPDPEDRRSVRAEVTNEGRRRYIVGTEALAHAQQQVLGVLKADDREALSRILPKLLSIESPTTPK
jgi:DNA-binding MarR family transcriptional regulator